MPGRRLRQSRGGRWGRPGRGWARPTTLLSLAACYAALCGVDPRGGWSWLRLGAGPLAADALYFLIEDNGEENCFVEEMPPRTHAVGTYKNADWSDGDPKYVRITAKDVDDTVIHTQVAEIEGRFAFSSEEGGLYQICLQVEKNATTLKKTGGWGWRGGGAQLASGLSKEKQGKYRFHLSVDVGVHARDYNTVMKKEHLSELEVEVLKLTDRVKDISRELAYQNRREEAFRSTSESTNSRVVWWSVLQMCVMIASAVFQSRHLQRFFESKKLR